MNYLKVATSFKFMICIASLSSFLHLGTTFVIMEDGVEVGRWEENDGKDAIEEIEFKKVKQKPREGYFSKATSSPSSQVFSEGWYHNLEGYNKAMDLKAGRPQAIALYFTATWCAPCKIFEKEVLKAEKVVKYLAPVIKVEIDVDQARSVYEKYTESGLPTFLVLGRDNKVTDIEALSTNPDEFIQGCKAAGLA